MDDKFVKLHVLNLVQDSHWPVNHTERKRRRQQMGTTVFYVTIHTKRCQRSQEKIAFVFAFAQCEWALSQFWSFDVQWAPFNAAPG